MKRYRPIRPPSSGRVFRVKLLTLCFFFVIGIVAGWTAHLAVGQTDNAMLQKYILQYAHYAASEGDLTASIISVLGVYFRYPIAMIVAGFTSAALFIIPLLVATQAFFAAFSVACFTSALGNTGVLLALSAFAVRYLVLLPVTLLLGVFAMDSATNRMHRKKPGKDATRIQSTTPSVFCGLICATALLIGVAIELLVVPHLLELALANIM